MTGPIPAKFFVNEGVVTSRTDMLHLLRPLLKQTVTYRYLRGRDVVAHGTGWMERIVVDADDTSTYFTPLAITLIGGLVVSTLLTLVVIPVVYVTFDRS